MLDQLLFYSLAVYLVFHVINRSSILESTREWGRKVCPRWVGQLLSCALCFTFWIGVLWTAWLRISTGDIIISVSTLLAAPVVNLVLDLVVNVLLKANAPRLPPTLDY